MAAPPSPLSTWQMGFFAMTVMLGDTVDDARASLRPEDARLLEGVAMGTDADARTLRAKQVAGALQIIGAHLEELRLA